MQYCYTKAYFQEFECVSATVEGYAADVDVLGDQLVQSLIRDLTRLDLALLKFAPIEIRWVLLWM